MWDYFLIRLKVRIFLGEVQVDFHQSFISVERNNSEIMKVSSGANALA